MSLYVYMFTDTSRGQFWQTEDLECLHITSVLDYWLAIQLHIHLLKKHIHCLLLGDYFHDNVQKALRCIQP